MGFPPLWEHQNVYDLRLRTLGEIGSVLSSAWRCNLSVITSNDPVGKWFLTTCHCVLGVGSQRKIMHHNASCLYVEQLWVVEANFIHINGNKDVHTM